MRFSFWLRDNVKSLLRFTQWNTDALLNYFDYSSDLYIHHAISPLRCIFMCIFQNCRDFADVPPTSLSPKPPGFPHRQEQALCSRFSPAAEAWKVGWNSHCFPLVGDGRQPNGRFLYTHYKDSLFFRWDEFIPNAGSWSTLTWKAINDSCCYARVKLGFSGWDKLVCYNMTSLRPTHPIFFRWRWICCFVCIYIYIT